MPEIRYKQSGSSHIPTKGLMGMTGGSNCLIAELVYSSRTNRS